MLREGVGVGVGVQVGVVGIKMESISRNQRILLTAVGKSAQKNMAPTNHHRVKCMILCTNRNNIVGILQLEITREIFFRLAIHGSCLVPALHVMTFLAASLLDAIPTLTAQHSRSHSFWVSGTSQRFKLNTEQPTARLNVP